MGDNDFQVGKLVASVEALTKSVDTLQEEVRLLNNFKIKLMTASSLISIAVAIIVKVI